MQCEEVAVLIPSSLDDDQPVPLPVQTHVEACLRCQAELARYKRMLRGLQLLRTQLLEPAPGLLGLTLSAIGDASEQHVIRSLLNKRKVAYVGAIGGAVAAAGAAAAIIAVQRSRRRAATALATT